jgi:hypothetical protein
MGEVSRVAMSLMSVKTAAYLVWIQLRDPDQPYGEPDLDRSL